MAALYRWVEIVCYTRADGKLRAIRASGAGKRQALRAEREETGTWSGGLSR